MAKEKELLFNEGRKIFCYKKCQLERWNAGKDPTNGGFLAGTITNTTHAFSADGKDAGKFSHHRPGLAGAVPTV